MEPPRVKTFSSPVWQFMEKVKSADGTDMARCRLCGKCLKCPNYTTSSCLKHLRAVHPKETKGDADKGILEIKPSVPKQKYTIQVSDGPVVASQVWDVMSKNAQGTKVTCSLCGAVFSWSAGQTISELENHLQRNHSDAFSAIAITPVSGNTEEVYAIVKQEAGSHIVNTIELHSPDATIPQIVATEPSGAKIMKMIPESLATKRWNKKKKLDSLLMDFISSSLLPFSVAGNRSFLEFVHLLDPQYSLPGEGLLSTLHLNESYENIKQHMKLSLQQQAETVSVTLDKWSPTNSSSPAVNSSNNDIFFYLTISVHFLSLSWDYTSMMLNTVCVSDASSAQEVAEKLRSEFEQWEIQNKIDVVVSDLTPSIVAALEMLSLKHVPCFVNNLNHVVHDALMSSENIATIANRVKAIVNYFEAAAEHRQVLYDQDNSESCGKKFIVHEETYWPSTAKMFRRYLEKHESVSSALHSLSMTSICISADEVAFIKQVLETLEPFELATEELCSEKNPKLSIAIPVIRQLQEHLSDLPGQDFELTSTLKQKLDEWLRSVENNFETGVTTVLNPRFKYVPFSEHRIAKDIEDRLTTMISALFTTESPVQSRTSSTEESPPPRKKKSLWNKYDSKVKHIIEAAAPSITGAMIEMRRYVESQLIQRQEIDPIQWWKENLILAPHLSKLARQYLSIPASSVPATRFFSKAGRQVVAKRSCINQKHIGKLLVLQNHCENSEMATDASKTDAF